MPQASAKLGMGRRDPRVIHGRGVKVYQLHQAVPNPGRDFGILRRLYKKRNPGKAVLKAVLGLLNQAVIPGVIPVIAEEKDHTVVIDSRLFHGVPQSAELLIHLHAHPLVHCPQLVPVIFIKTLQILIGADHLLHPGFAAAILRTDAPGKLLPVNGGKVRFLHLIGGVGIHKPQENTQRPVLFPLPDQTARLIHRLIVKSVIKSLVIGP